jgi:hypothetical protein
MSTRILDKGILMKNIIAEFKYKSNKLNIDVYIFFYFFLKYTYIYTFFKCLYILFYKIKMSHFDITNDQRKDKMINFNLQLKNQQQMNSMIVVLPLCSSLELIVHIGLVQI